MPNDFGSAIQADSGWIAKKSLSMIMTKLSFAMSMDKRYTREFMDMDFPIGESMTVRKKFRPVGRTGMTMVEQNISNKKITIQMNQPFGVDLAWDDWEKMLKMPREQAAEYMEPSIDYIATQVEVAAFNFAVANTPNVVGKLGTDPNDSTIADDIRVKLMNQGGYREGQTNAYFTPSAMRSIRAGERLTFNPGSDQSDFFRQGYLGQAAGIKWNESVCIPRFTAGVFAGAFAVGAAGQSGNTLGITGTNGDIIKAGTVVSIAGTKFVNPATRAAPGTDAYTFQTLSDVTIAGGVGTLTMPPGFEIVGPGDPYQNIDTLPAAGAALTIWPGTTTPGIGKNGALGIAAAPEAFFMVSAKWPDQAPGVEISNAKSQKTGIELSIVKGYEIRNRKSLIRIDCAIGFGAALAENAATIVALG
jgi:hypothetical protein